MRARILAFAACLATALAAAPPRLPGAGPRVYDGPWNWEHPNELRLTEDETFPHTPYEQDYQSHSFYWMGRLDSGHIVVISPFQWRYGAIDAWGLYVIVRDPRGRVFTWDGKLGDGAPGGSSARHARVRREEPVRDLQRSAPLDHRRARPLVRSHVHECAAGLEAGQRRRAVRRRALHDLQPARTVGRPRRHDDRERRDRRGYRPVPARHERDGAAAHPHERGVPGRAGVELPGHAARRPVVHRDADHASRTPPTDP